MDQCHLACQPGRDPWGGMQSDRPPAQSGTFRRYLMFRAEIARSIRTVDFKPIVATVGRDQPEIVQKRGAKRRFLIGYRPAEAFDGKTAENVSSKTMGAKKLGRAGFQK